MVHVMRRRAVVATGALLAAPLAFGQPSARIPRIGYLFSFVPSQGEHLWAACRQGLAELGYVEGKSVALEPRWADGKHERLPALVADLRKSKVDVIVSAATPASLAAKAGAGGIPIVIVAVADPVYVGLVASLAHPGGGVTGLTLLTPELSGKRLEILAAIRPSLQRVAVLQNPGNRSHEVFLRETRLAGDKIGIAVEPVLARTADDLGEAFTKIAGDAAQALVVFDDPVFWSNRKRIVEAVARGQLPTMYGYSEYVDDGGLVSYGPHRPDLYRRTAGYVDKILNGAKPADLPIERPTRFELYVNARTASSLGLKLSRLLLLQADKVIE